MIQLGYLDTNIFLHSLYPRDWQYPRCQAILKALDEGRAEGWVDVAALHELAFRLLRLALFPDRAGARTYLEGILLSNAILADDKPALFAAIYLWENDGVGFVDAWLTVQASQHGLPICSANVRDFPAQLQNTFVSGDL